MRTVKVGKFQIGDHHPIHIIAEIGGNFLKFEEAKRLIDLAMDVGADSVKLQTYRADTIASKSAVYDMPNVGAGASQHDLFKKYEIDLSLHKEVFDYCASKGIMIFSTPSHMEDVELLEKVDCPVYKIGSDDACNIPFLEDVAAVGKPIILSTGMCTMEEVRESVSAILGKGNPNLILLHCVTNYPADPSSSNLLCIGSMKKEFGLPVGYSDHTVGIACCIGASAMGANVIEKHFTYDKNAEGPDHMLSADPDEMRQIVDNIRILEKAFGDGIKRPSESEKTTRVNNRKSIIAAKDIQQGSSISSDMLAIKRPGYGIPPKYINQISGRIAKTDIKAESPITWDDV